MDSDCQGNDFIHNQIILKKQFTSSSKNVLISLPDTQHYLYYLTFLLKWPKGTIFRLHLAFKLRTHSGNVTKEFLRFTDFRLMWHNFKFCFPSNSSQHRTLDHSDSWINGRKSRFSPKNFWQLPNVKYHNRLFAGAESRFVPRFSHIARVP